MVFVAKSLLLQMNPNRTKNSAGRQLSIELECKMKPLVRLTVEVFACLKFKCIDMKAAMQNIIFMATR